MQEDCGKSMVITSIAKDNSTRYLGMHLGKSLTWAYHVDSVCSKVA